MMYASIGLVVALAAVWYFKRQQPAATGDAVAPVVTPVAVAPAVQA